MAELKYVDWDGLVYYDGKIKSYIADKAEDYLKMGGIIPFNKLPDPSFQNLNYIYKITDEFVSNSDFEKPGYTYKSGTWVQVTDINNSAVYRYTIFNEETIGSTADLSNYYTKSEVEEIVQEAVDSIDIPDVSNLATKEELEAVQNVAGSNSVRLFAIESDLVDLSNKLENIPTTYATKEEVAAVEAKVDAIVLPEVPTKVSELENDAGYITAEDIPETDLSNYYNKEETENLIAEAVKDIEHPTVDLEGYATEEWVNTQGFLKEHQDLSEYAKKDDIPQPELFVIDYNSPNFSAAFDAYKAGKLLILTNAAPDVDSYAIMNYVRADLITFTKFLMSRSNAYGAFNTYYLHSDNTWEVAKEVILNKVEAEVGTDNNISGIVIGKDTYKFDNFATTENITKITQDIENIENNYVSNTYITQNYTTTQELESTYVTQEKVTEVVTNEVNTVVTEQIETKVTEVVQEKIESGDINVAAESIKYDTWD